jgi:hypothetical protein
MKMSSDTEHGHEHKKNIFVNKKKIEVAEENLTGSQILQKAGLKADEYDLFLVHGQQSDKIAPDQSIHIENGMHFNAILKSVPYG